MATAAAIHTALGRPGGDPAQLVLHSHVKLQRKLGTSWEHGASANLILTSL